MILLKHIRHILIQRHVGNTKIFHVGLILVIFTEGTIIAKLLPKDMNEEERKRTLEERYVILTKVKKLINEFLNPFDSINFKGDMTIDQILSDLEITKSEYYSRLSTAAQMEHEIHLKRPPNSCFINNFNPIASCLAS